MSGGAGEGVGPRIAHLLRRLGNRLRKPGAATTLGLLAALFAIIAQALSPGDLDPSWRRGWFDALQRIDARERPDCKFASREPASPEDCPVVVIAIDGIALEKDGRWPWPRDLVAELLTRIAQYEPRAVAFDILFIEPDGYAPDQLAEHVMNRDADLAAGLFMLPDPDTKFSRAILSSDAARAPVVLPVPGLEAVKGESVDTPDHPTTVRVPPELADRAYRFADGEWPLGALAVAASGIGGNVPNTERRNVTRKLTTLQNIGGALVASFAVETLRAAEGATEAVFSGGPGGLEHVEMGDLEIPVDADGAMWLRWGRFDNGRYVSASAVLGGIDLADVIRDRIVFVAVTAQGGTDERQSALGEFVWGVETHVQAIEQTLAGRSLDRPDWAYAGETAVIVLLTIAAAFLIPALAPAAAVAATLAALAALMGGSVLAFRAGFLLDGGGPALALALVAVPTFARTLIDRENLRLLAELALARQKAETARLDAELNTAREIQLSLLPAKTFSRAGAIEVACAMIPARQVGGDFYDHFMIGEDRLFFSVGDVSDKGVPASLFMALSKSLWKSVSLRMDADLGAALAMANDEITRDNTESMFVTGIACVIDLESREIAWSGAGHDMPVRFGRGRAAEVLEDASGPPFGLVADLDFPVARGLLHPGEGICLFTDGVTEAQDEAGAFYGMERLHAVLNALPPEMSAEAAVRTLTEDVERFRGTAEPSDDLTLLIAKSV